MARNSPAHTCLDYTVYAALTLRSSCPDAPAQVRPCRRRRADGVDAFLVPGLSTELPRPQRTMVGCRTALLLQPGRSSRLCLHLFRRRNSSRRRLVLDPDLAPAWNKRCVVRHDTMLYRCSRFTLITHDITFALQSHSTKYYMLESFVPLSDCFQRSNHRSRPNCRVAMGNVVSVAATDMFSNVSLTTRGLVFFSRSEQSQRPFCAISESYERRPAVSRR